MREPAVHGEGGARGSAAPTGYAEAHRGAIVVPRTDRVVWSATGRDPVKMLHGLVTNDVQGATPERGVYAALLTPKGRMVSELRLFRRPDGSVLFDAPAAAADSLAETLKKFVPPLFARFAAAPLRVLGVYGPAARDVITRGLEVEIPETLPREEGVADALEDGGALIVRTPYAGVDGFDLLVPEDSDAERALVAAGALEASPEALEVLRIEAGNPRWGAELTEETIPLEAGLRERAISETKGCYTGQEVIIRILHRGHVNWRLRGLVLGGAAVPEPGATLVRPGEEKTVARITSACASPRHGQTIALGYARRELSAGDTLRLGAPDGPEARLVELPFPS